MRMPCAAITSRICTKLDIKSLGRQGDGSYSLFECVKVVLGQRIRLCDYGN